MAEQNDLFLSKKDQTRQKQTPLMRQYWKIKDRHPGALLLFRMGDFYETFEDDAVVVADVLGITLTKRGNGAAEDTPLAGFPHHALDQHLPKLVQAGHRVAVCEQLEDPKYARKIVKRGVVEVVTPGVAFRDPLLQSKRSTYLAAVAWGEPSGRRGQGAGTVGLAFADASTGEFYLTEAPAERLSSLLQTVAPAEVVVDKRHVDRLHDAVRAVQGGAVPFAVTKQEDWVFGLDFATETLLRHFQTHSLKGFGVDDLTVGVTAAGAALYYLGETQKGRIPHVRRLQRYRSEDHIALDPATKRNLELVASMQDGRRDGSLVGVLDATLTPMGGRLLRQWLVRPLRDVGRITARLDAVDALYTSPRLRRAVREELRHVGDLERLCGKVCTARATPRDLVALGATLRRVPAVQAALGGEDAGLLGRLRERLTPCDETADQIGAALADEPPATLAAGGAIRAGYSAELDELRETAGSGKEYLTTLQARESKRTGIPSLKVGYNKVFGYYLEVTNAHKDKAPPEWTRKQTLVNAERYITPELKEYEETILTAQEKSVALETRLFTELRDAVAEAVEPVQENARALAALDVLASFAEVAERNGYARPQVDDSLVLDVVDGRHPVVEQALPAGEAFIPNSVRLAAPPRPSDAAPPEGDGGAVEADAGGAGEKSADAGGAGQVLLITGPNMAGKSVVLRQTALVVLLAQVGCFVPAARARVGVVDALFTRVGASDNLAAGESTFLVEMNETANILNNATERSLILLDEVGRGTSTFDGLSLAWAIVEHLHETPEKAARTLFATHYHELDALSERLARVQSYSVRVQEHDGRVVFLRTLVPGGADHSYGIEVARMAGLPPEVVARAKDVLRHLEANDVAAEVGVRGAAPPAGGDGVPAPPRAAVGGVPAPSEAPVALHLPDPIATDVLDRLGALDPDRMTPIEALMALAELKRTAEG
ncbi:DNA mismatch repair protein MutS [Rubrivirga litoralis]|uniref:DNA mismatch repair protein MutS n=1 Tax=Rubrivirga litoralis TaxID=3075598 RepID=A0ABU3BRE1_9BACT|nr:DNA mismatch repair protein MutS [Rubrivirga sp. F394]MDT0631857.1 DNA mismatch repair protein MutS [Rubrivirga sp. F394]